LPAAPLPRLHLFGVTGWPGTGLDILIAAVVILALWFVAGYLRGWVQGELSKRLIQPEVVQLLSKVTFRVVIVLGVVVVALIYLGGTSLGASGVLVATILAAMGVQDILRNYVSGVYLLTERRFNVGDEIEFGGHRGTITEIRFRVTYLRGANDELIIAPNADLFNSTVVVVANRALEKGRGVGRAQAKPSIGRQGGRPPSK
jgi:small-conductance mechanosensitive channel